MSMLRERTQDIAEQRFSETWTGEVMAFCPECKVLQAIWINEGTLVPTRKFSQIGSRVYHECGSSRPCRLYNSW
ncbi:MAG: hypothetical protein Q7R50_00755 [Dehalococcoidales bacterium]|nr:hypothetical protein [Dehalococcoidales bacterium]